MAHQQQQQRSKGAKVNDNVRELKVVLVGDKRVGKTAVIQQLVYERFLDCYTPTNFDTYGRQCEVGGWLVNFALWDTSGSVSSDRVRPLAYSGANVFLICFSIGDPDSLNNTVTKWQPEIRAHCPTTPILLCGCGSDLRNDIETISNLAREQKIPVTSEQALRVSRKIEATTYVETSAKTARSVKDAFDVAALAGMGKLNSKSFSLRRFSLTGQKVMLDKRTKSKLELSYDLKSRTPKHCLLM